MIKNIVFDMGRVLLDYMMRSGSAGGIRTAARINGADEQELFLPKNGCFWIGNHPHGGRGIKTRAEEDCRTREQGDGPIMSGPLA